MKFQFTMVLAALTVTAKADWWRIDTYCTTTSCDSWPAVWYTDNTGGYDFNANEGCRSPGVPGVEIFCIDWGNKRGHFQAVPQLNQPKRCLRMSADYDYSSRPGCGSTGSCRRSEWRETACNWWTTMVRMLLVSGQWLFSKESHKTVYWTIHRLIVCRWNSMPGFLCQGIEWVDINRGDW